MSVFVVRLRPDGFSHPRLVGIYRAEGPVELEEKVLQDVSGRNCEYALIRHGSMYAPDIEEGLGARLYTEASESKVRSVDDLSDDWRELFFGGEPLIWSPLGADAGKQVTATDRIVLAFRAA